MSNISLQNLTFKYENQAENLFDQLNLTFDTDWKTGLIGRNGRGKTTLLKILAGKVASPYWSKVHYGYFPLTITDDDDYAVNLFEIEPEDQWQVEMELAKLELDSAKLWQPFKTLSGGEQVKIMLAVLFSRDYDYLLLDEPTIYLDLPTKQIVKRYLQSQQQGFILVSHDMDFLNEVVDHIVSLEADGVLVFKGNYDVYVAERERLEKNYMMQNQKIKAEIKRLEQSAREKAEWSSQKEATKFGNPKVKGSKTRDDKGFLGSRAAKMMKKSKQMEDKINKQIAAKEQQLV